VRDANGKLTSFGGLSVVSTLQEALDRSGICIGIYGRPGVGKTTLAAQLADPKLNPSLDYLPMLLLDAEAGVHSVAHLLGDNFQQIPITTFKEFELFCESLANSSPQDFPWKTVYVDNVSDLLAKGLAETGYHGFAGEISSQPDYGIVTTQMTDCIRKLRDASQTHGINVILSLWEKQDFTEGGQTLLQIRADLPPKLGRNIHGILNYIGYLSIERTPQGWARRLSFSVNPLYNAKWRARPMSSDNTIPEELWNPNLVDIFNTIKKGAAFPATKYAKPVKA